MSERRLYRKGDQIAVVYTVVRDQNETDTFVNCDRISRRGRVQIDFSEADLAVIGTLTPAPEPKYIPEVGDVFSYGVSGHERVCLFIDDKRVVSDRLHPPRLEQWDIDPHNNFVFIRKAS